MADKKFGRYQQKRRLGMVPFQYSGLAERDLDAWRKRYAPHLHRWDWDSGRAERDVRARHNSRTCFH